MIKTEDERLNELKKLYFSGEPCDRKYIGSELCAVFLSALETLWSAEYFIISDYVYDREGIQATMTNDMSVSNLNSVFNSCNPDGRVPNKYVIAQRIFADIIFHNALLSHAGKYCGHTFSRDVFFGEKRELSGGEINA